MRNRPSCRQEPACAGVRGGVIWGPSYKRGTAHDVVCVRAHASACLHLCSLVARMWHGAAALMRRRPHSMPSPRLLCRCGNASRMLHTASPLTCSVALQDALERVSEGRTVVTIAHRLSTMAAADEIAVLAVSRFA